MACCASVSNVTAKLLTEKRESAATIVVSEPVLGGLHHRYWREAT
jgi:hypothetical protein